MNFPPLFCKVTNPLLKMMMDISILKPENNQFTKRKETEEGCFLNTISSNIPYLELIQQKV